MEAYEIDIILYCIIYIILYMILNYIFHTLLLKSICLLLLLVEAINLYYIGY